MKGRTKTWEVKEYEIWDLPEFNIEHELNIYKVFDFIFCLEVFEYLINPQKALRNIETLLKNKGRAYISAPLVYPVHQEIEMDSLRYTENGFKRLCDTVGLRVSSIVYRYDASGLLEDFYLADGMHPAKGFDHNITGYIFEVTK